MDLYKINFIFSKNINYIKITLGVYLLCYFKKVKAMLVHKELVDKVYEYQNLVRELEKIEQDVESYVLKSADISLENQKIVWNDIHTILKESAENHNPELAIAQLDLIMAQIRVNNLVKKVETKGIEETTLENVVLFDKVETN